jgi:hypothetical protein
MGLRTVLVLNEGKDVGLLKEFFKSYLSGVEEKLSGKVSYTELYEIEKALIEASLKNLLAETESFFFVVEKEKNRGFKGLPDVLPAKYLASDIVFKIAKETGLFEAMEDEALMDSNPFEDDASDMWEDMERGIRIMEKLEEKEENDLSPNLPTEGNDLPSVVPEKEETFIIRLGNKELEIEVPQLDSFKFKRATYMDTEDVFNLFEEIGEEIKNKSGKDIKTGDEETKKQLMKL